MKNNRSFALVTVLAFLALIATVGHAAANETADLASQVDALYTSWNRDDAPGAVVAVFKNGEIVYQQGFGMADLERDVPITPQSAFEIGSISKQFTAMCILLLENDGKLTIDDDIRNYVPEMPEYERPITLRHLLHHISGVRDIETLIPLAGMPWFNYYSDEQMLELITRQQALNFPPGEQYLYSNSGYILLAQVVARVSGKSLREFAQERIFGPLEMTHSVFWDHPGQMVPNRALAYSPRGDDGYALEMWNMPFAGPAGLYTTVGDLALWDANFYDNKLGGGAALIEQMETPGLLENGESSGYASGLVIGTHRGLAAVTHGGAWMGYRAGLRRYPEQHLTVAMLSNTASINVGPVQVANLYLADHFEASGGEQQAAYEPPTAIELSADELARYEGTYWNETESLMRTIEIHDAKLFYARGGGNATELGAVATGHFFMVGLEIPVNVEFQGSGGSRTMTVGVEDEDLLLFELIPSSSGDAVTAYAGAYWSDDLLRELRVEVEGEVVFASWADEEDRTAGRLLHIDDLLLPRFIPVPWYPQDTRLLFERDDTGSISGLSLSCDMVRGVKFSKQP